MVENKDMQEYENKNIVNNSGGYETPLKWGFKICGAIALLAVLMPLIVIVGLGSYPIKGVEIMGLMGDSISMPISSQLAISLLLFIMLLHIGLAILLILFGDFEFTRNVATIDVLIVICIRIILELMMGTYGGYDLIQSGSGWWLMLLPVLVVVVVTWILTTRGRKTVQ